MSRRTHRHRPQPAGQARLIALAAWRGVKELYNSEGLTHAAAIAYYALLSLFPIILLGLSVLGEMTSDSADRDAVVRFAFRYFPRQFAFIQGQLDAFRETPVTFGLRYFASHGMRSSNHCACSAMRAIAAVFSGCRW